LEAFARHADKGSALVELGARSARSPPCVFVGDDVTDEEAFARLGPDDVTIKVGDDDTIARHRLPDPDAVLAFLQATPHHASREVLDGCHPKNAWLVALSATDQAFFGHGWPVQNRVDWPAGGVRRMAVHGT
jgi:hypothetical protein